ncbi:PH domain-containing protein [Nocardiopsis sp. HNM0947]|uniref:PH domain-containing protein n=1 Tax=Nocardiopsis coralli TaxID=2772213 RepID=A0ABR9P6B6_9ACTN|nr:PH domain-containing protein [Nocardiopsis coralli]MBE2999384.1 PH domain-containing protein [Nocardiopsis coralli]
MSGHEEIEETQDTEAGHWQGLSRLSVWANTVGGALVIIPIAIAVTVTFALVPMAWWWALLPVPAAVLFIAGATYVDLLRLRRIRYRVTDERMEMRSGIIAKAHRSIPRERVRSVDVAAPLYARVFGLCTVTVGTGESAGAGGSDQLQLQFVTAEQGEELRRDLLQRGPAPGSSGEEAPAEEGEEELARLNPRWFAYAPATGATLGIGFGVLATLVGINAQMGGQGWEWLSQWLGLPSGAEIGAFILAQLLLLIPLTLFALLLLGVVVTLAVAVETWWDYRLARQDDGTVRLTRGLLTSVSLSVEGRRLNGVALREPFVLRSVGGAEIRAVATGLSAGDEQKTAAKSRLSPAMPGKGARALAATLLRTSDSPFSPAPRVHPRAALRRRFTRAGFATLGAVVVAGALTWVHVQVREAWAETLSSVEIDVMAVPLTSGTAEAAPVWGWFAAAALFGVVAFWYAVGSYRGLGHGLHPRHLVVRRGMAVRTTVALERSAVIGWRITRSPFQRRLGLADVSATTAAGEGLYTATDVGLGEGVAWAEGSVPDLLAPFVERVEGEDEGSGQGRSVLP